jgi:hypothetical protein
MAVHIPSDLPEGTARLMREALGLGESLKHETDRGVVLVGGGILDAALYDLLRAAFVDDKEVESLIGARDKPGDRPLATFSSRIKTAYSLGIISRAFYRQLDLVRDIRNKCAHSIDTIDFGTPPYSDQISRLRSEFYDRMVRVSPTQATPRNRVYYTILEHYGLLRQFAQTIKRRVVWPCMYDMAFESPEEQARITEWIRGIQSGQIPKPPTWLD